VTLQCSEIEELNDIFYIFSLRIALGDQMARIDVGRFFVFVKSKFLSVKIKLATKDYVKEVKVRKGVFPRILYDIWINENKYDKVALPKLRLLQVTTDRKIYQPGEMARVLIVNLGRPGSQVDLNIYLNNNLFYRESVNVDDYGFAIFEFDDLEIGEYSVEVKSDGYVARSKFTVAPFKLSVLQASLRKYAIMDSYLSAIVELSKLNIPFSGICNVGLYCGFCNATIVKKNVEFKEGVAKVDFDISGHTGPFQLHFTLEDGTTASLSIPHTRMGEREKVVLSTIGKIFSVSLVPVEKSIEARGLYIIETGSRASPLLLNEVVSEKIELKVIDSFSILTVVLYNPLSGEIIVHEFNDLQEGQTLSFDSFKPLTFVFIGGLSDDIYETSFALIYPEKLKVEIDSPLHVTPGEEFEVCIKSNMKARGVLIVYDSRLEHESLAGKIARNLYRNIKEFRELKAKKILSVKTARELRLPFLARAPVAAPSVVMFEEAVEPEKGFAESGGLALIQFRKTILPLAFFDVFEIDGEVVKKIKVGLHPTTWKVKFYAFADVDYIEKELSIEASKPVMLEIDAPVYLEEDEEVLIGVNYAVEGMARLYAETPWGRVEKTVKGSGVEFLNVKGPCRIKAYAIRNGFADAVELEIKKPGIEKVRFSKLMLLDKYEEEYGEKFVIYPSPAYLAKDLAYALIQYPFGCAEQTSSKLGGLGVVYKAVKNCILKENLEDLEKLIKTGIARMKLFYKDGLFSLWENGKPEVSVTIKVLKNLKHLYKIGFKELDEMADKAISRLLEHNIKDNDLLAYDSRFKTEITSVEDAVNVYLYSKDKDREKALRFILEAVEEKNGTAYWRAGKSWAGILEATCEALKAVYQAGYKDLFKKGFTFISSKLINGMLYTTSDTRAFIELVSFLQSNDKTCIELNGKVVEVDSITVVKGRVKALSDFVLARVDYEDIVDLFRITGKLKYSIEISSTDLKIGDKAVLKIIVDKDYFVPIARIWLPGNLTALEGGANIQVIHQPIKDKILKVEVVAVRKGTAKLRSLVYDMYDSSKIGISPPIRVTVS